MITTKEVAEVTEKRPVVLRRYIRSRGIPRDRRLGDGPAKQVDALALIAALREDRQFEDADKIEAWLVATGRLAQAS